MRAVLSVDRRSVNVRGALALMADVRFEKPLAEPAANADGDPADGDLLKLDLGKDVLDLEVAVVAKTGARRRLGLVPRQATVPLRLARVYELSLPKLREAPGDGVQVFDGAPARLAAGDVLEIVVSARAGAAFRLVGPDGGATADLTLPKTFSRTVRVTLTNEPVVEPPPALYAALVLAPNEDGQRALALPLYAQSTLPERVDWQNLKEDFRRKLVHRSATFAWSLLRARSELGAVAGAPALGAGGDTLAGAGAADGGPNAGGAGAVGGGDNGAGDVAPGGADAAGAGDANDAKVAAVPGPTVRVAIVKSDRNGQTHLPANEDQMVPPRRV